MRKIEYSISECEDYINEYAERLDEINNKNELDPGDIKYKKALNKRIKKWKKRLKRKAG